MLVIFGLDDRYGLVFLMIEDVVCPTFFTSGMELTANDDAACGKGYFLSYLSLDIPSGLFDGWGDLFGTYITFG